MGEGGGWHGWEFALVALLKRVTLNKKSNKSEWLPLLFLKERLEQNEQIALFIFSNTRAIHTLWKSDSRFLRVGFRLCSFLKRKLKTYITLFGFAVRVRNSLFCSHRSFKRATRAIRSYCSLQKGLQGKEIARKRKFYPLGVSASFSTRK